MIKIRASSLPGYSDCARRWAANAIPQQIANIGFTLNKQMATSIGASIGTATHGGVAFLLTEKMQTGHSGNMTEAEQRALSELETALEENGVLWDDVSPRLSDAQRQIVRMVKSYNDFIAPDITPIAVEQRLEVKVGNLILTGQSDTQVVEPDYIRDTKTGKMPRTHYAQLGSYSLLARTKRPDAQPKGLCVDFIKRAPIKTEQPAPVTEIYDQATAEQAAMATIRRISDDLKEFERRIVDEDAPPEHAFLANPGSNLCSPKWCPCYNTSFCREHKGAK